MNWEAIGAVGEIVGALAVVASLTYVAVQLKAANTLTQVQTRENANEAFDRWRSKLVLDEDLGALWDRGIDAPETLSETEANRFRWLIIELMHNTRVQFLRAKDLGQQEELDRVLTVLSSWVNRPGWVAFWPLIANAMEPAFRSVVEEQMISDPRDRLDAKDDA